jgi:hypothetical protein
LGKTVETIADFKEIVDGIKAKGGEAFKLLSMRIMRHGLPVEQGPGL